MKTRLEEQQAAKRSIDGLVYKLEVSISRWIRGLLKYLFFLSRCQKEISGLKERNHSAQEDSSETELVIETSARQAGALREKIHELTVEDKMLSMTEIKIKEEVRGGSHSRS